MSFGKEQFVAYMKQYQEACDANNKEVDRVNGILTVDWICDVTGRHHKLVTSLMEKLFDFHNDWIDWFCFENDFGRTGHVCRENDGPDVPIKNAGDLWDFVRGKKN